MLYFKVVAIRRHEEDEKRVPIRRMFEGIREKIEAYDRAHCADKEILFLSDVTDNLVKIFIICETPFTDNERISEMLTFLGFEIDRFTCEECMYCDILDGLHEGSNNDFIDDPGAILDRAEIDGLRSRGEGICFGENLIPEMTDEEIEKTIESELVSQSFQPEFARIKRSPKKKKIIHPVQYLLAVKEKKKRKTVACTLLSALHSHGRLLSRRYSYIDVNPDDSFVPDTVDRLFKSSKDAAIVIRFNCEPTEDECVATFDTECINLVCEKIKEYRNRVLSIICYQPDDQGMSDHLLNQLSTVNMVKITEDTVRKKEATAYLKAIASKNDLKTDRKLFEKLDDESTYDCADLEAMFNDWLAAKVAKDYPMYAQLPFVELPKVKKEKVTAYDEIQKLIGLESAKAMVDNVIDYYKAMNIFRTKGLVTDTPSRHIVLTGNPGTCKTTFARLLARTLAENCILSSGSFVECGKGDLCAKYVGWTAKTVKEKFKRASGGVLFIDEAYSLDEHGRGGSFAEEAINTIVQEMENHRDDVIVVFAGYPDPMEDFLKTNPGLRSRIAFHINMQDYTTDELLQISELTAEKKGMRLSPAALEKLKGLYDNARQDPEYGAGRYVRNVIEQAKMTHVSRIMKSGRDMNSVEADELLTIQPEDIETKVVHVAAETKRRIGFAS